MVSALNTAVTGGADGIAISLIDLHAFNAPVEAALKAGIPVVAYNADAPPNKRLSYIGQNSKMAGELIGRTDRHRRRLGRRGAVHRHSGLGQLAAPPGRSAEKAIKASGKPITPHTVATGAAVPGEHSTINAYWVGHPSTKGMYSFDGG